MARRKYSSGEIIHKLREADVLHGIMGSPGNLSLQGLVGACTTASKRIIMHRPRPQVTVALTRTRFQPPVPVEIKLDRPRRQLTVAFDDGQSFAMTSEYLRVHSPSAEVSGHGGEGTLQLDKQDVTITGIEPVGNYAVRLIFSDGHSTGLFTWKVLFELGSQQEAKWQEYLARLAAAGHARDLV